MDYPKVHKPDVEYFAWGEKKHKYIYALEDADPFHVFNDVGFVMDDEFFDKVMKEVVKVCKKIEPDCTIVL